MTVKELIAKLERFRAEAEVRICYDDAYCIPAILDVYEDERGRVLLSEAMERDDKGVTT